jgi:uncharacterized membrane protein YphA (DoxX/SURF4 family)
MNCFKVSVLAAKGEVYSMEQSLLIAVVLVLSRLFVGGILILAGVLKLKAGSGWFLQQILAYKLVKDKIASLLARGLPWAEILCGILLLIGFVTPLVAIISFALLWGFTAAITSTFLRGKPVDCGCFGRRTDTQAQWTIVYRNLGLMFILGAISVAGHAPLSLDILLNKRFSFVDLNAFLASWFITIWVSSLIFIIGLHLRMRRRLLSGEEQNQSVPSVHSN